VSNGGILTSPTLLEHSLRRRIERLEGDLYPEVRINVYHDVPFAIFRYDPSEELELRKQVEMLKTRLENRGRQVLEVSLAEVMREALEMGLHSDWEAFYRAEAEQGIEAAVQTVHHILTDRHPLHTLVADGLRGLDSLHQMAFLTRAALLYPTYRTSALLDHLLAARVRVPIVLFYPGTLEGVAGLRFMGVLEAEHNYRAQIY